MALRNALLVIDVQLGLFAAAPPPFDADAVIDRINQLSERARAAAVPVVFVQHEREGSPLAYGSDGWQLEPGLIVKDSDAIVRKTTPDAFLNTNLQSLLNAWGVTQLVITGYASEFCVDTTTRRAAALGFDVILAADAHTTHDKAHASAAQIRAHENATLPNITSFGPRIEAKPVAEINLVG